MEEEDLQTQPLLGQSTNNPSTNQRKDVLGSGARKAFSVCIALCVFACVVAGVFVAAHRASPFYNSLPSRIARKLWLRPSTAPTPPPEWIPLIKNHDMVFNPNDDTSVPFDLMPTMANGFVVQMINSGRMYIHGVFNGPQNATHRAQIPAPLMLTIGDSCFIPCVTVTAGAVDMRNATFHRMGTVNTTGGNIRFTQRYYAHRAIHSLLVAEIDFTPEQPLTSQVDLMLQLNKEDSSDVHEKVNTSLPDRTITTGTTLQTESPSLPPTLYATVCSIIPPTVTIPANATPGIPISFHFHCAVRSSVEDGIETEEEVVEAANHHFEEAGGMGVGELYQSHVDAWATLWQSGVEISGRPDVALTNNATLFALLASSHPQLPFGLAPGGLTDGYGGHSFWDVETWMYPGLLALHPQIAKSLLDYRFIRAQSARDKAYSYAVSTDKSVCWHNHNFSGLMYPWESAFSGLEACPAGYGTGTFEQHISGDISVAAQQYWWMVRDKEWLQTVGATIIQGIADFWTSRAETSSGMQALGPADDGVTDLHILDVIPPDEYHQGNDSVYTNYVAIASLSGALDLQPYLGATGREKSWTSVRDRLVILFNQTSQIHPEFAGYTGSLIKQADVVLLPYPIGIQFSDKIRQNDLDYYSSRTDPNGPAMTYGMHAIGYLDLNDQQKANSYFNTTFEARLDGSPYAVWSELPKGGGCHNFVTGAGGYLQTVVFGWPGIRITSSGVNIRTRVLPENASFMKVRNFAFVGNRFNLEFDNTKTSLTLVSSSEPAEAVFVQVNGAVPAKLMLQNVPLVCHNSDLLHLFADSYQQ